VADNSTQGGADTIRDKDRTGVKTQIQGLDLNIGGASEVLQTAAALADATANPTVPAWAVMGMLFNGTTWDRIRGDTTNGIDVDVTRLPGSPAQEHTTAASPGSARLSDGAAFYDATKTGQLPSALVSGRLDVNIGATTLSSLAVANVETIADNAGFTDGTSKVFPQGYIFDESAGTALTENDVGAARMDSKRAIVNVLEDATTRGRRATISATGGLLGDQGAPAAQANAWFVRPRKVATYRAVFRAAARPYSLSNVFGAAGRKQFATIHHASSATKTVRLRHVWVEAESSSAGAAYYYDLVRITAAPATGNPAITASKADSSASAAEATTLALPTTAGTEEAQAYCTVEQVIGVTAATPSVVNPPPGHAYFDLVDIQGSNADDESQLPTIRAGVLEGWAVTVDCSAAATWRGVVVIEFTEE